MAILTSLGLAIANMVKTIFYLFYLSYPSTYFILTELPDRLLYLAIPESVFLDFFSEALPKSVIKFNRVKLLIFQPETEEIVQWIP